MSNEIGPVHTHELPALEWRTSSFTSGGSGNCVEVGRFDDGSGRVAVRHSKHPEAAAIVYTRAEWEAFLAGAKSGEFDG